MHARNFSFFIIDDEINIKDGPVSIIVDHEAVMSVVYFDHWDSLAWHEKEFASWYQNNFLARKFVENCPVAFIVSSVLLEPYDQDGLCKTILEDII